MLYQAYLAYAESGDTNCPEQDLAKFSDQNVISSWAARAVNTMSAWGIMNGVSETEFGPKATYTREQCYVTFLRLYKNATEGRLQGAVKNPRTWEQIAGGCSGNLQGISRLIEGMRVEGAISKMEGIRCGMRSTSHPNQIAQALKQTL